MLSQKSQKLPDAFRWDELRTMCSSYLEEIGESEPYNPIQASVQRFPECISPRCEMKEYVDNREFYSKDSQQHIFSDEIISYEPVNSSDMTAISDSNRSMASTIRSLCGPQIDQGFSDVQKASILDEHAGSISAAARSAEDITPRQSHQALRTAALLALEAELGRLHVIARDAASRGVAVEASRAHALMKE